MYVKLTNTRTGQSGRALPAAAQALIQSGEWIDASDYTIATLHTGETVIVDWTIDDWDFTATETTETTETKTAKGRN